MLPSHSLRRIRCCRTDFGSVAADLTSSTWSELQPVEMVEAVTGAPPKQGTRVRVGWDARDLRVLFEAVDQDPWATLTERDAALYTEEVVEIFVDPVGDLESYFEIEVNPLNAVLDLMLRRNRSGYLKDFAWQCDGLRTAVQLIPGGWVAEFAIPFASIAPEMPKPGTEWRVNFLRIDRPKETDRELSAWSPTKVGTFHVPQRFGTLVFEA